MSFARIRRAPQGARGLKSFAVSLNPLLIGRAPQGARGLKSCSTAQCCTQMRRAPQGARGLKFGAAVHRAATHASRPARGAWVEISPHRAFSSPTPTSRPARGAWVEISHSKVRPRANGSRAPQGARGLKFDVFLFKRDHTIMSRPARGAWVEMPSGLWCTSLRWSRPARGAWVEMESDRSGGCKDWSRPARGAWVEIFRQCSFSAR